MAQHPARGDKSKGSTGRLSRPLIVDTAIAYIDEHGTRALTMRELGGELGVEAMSLYRYVAGREDLLEAVVTALLDGLSDRLDKDLTGTWQGYLQTLAHSVRRIAIDHPGVFPLVATRHPAAAWLRPPLRSLELVQDFLETLSSHGFTDAQVVQTYRGFSGFLLGNLLLDAAQRGAQTSPVEEPLDEGGAQVPNRDGRTAPGDNPILQRFKPLLSEDHSDEEFEIGLETLLDRLEMVVSQ